MTKKPAKKMKNMTVSKKEHDEWHKKHKIPSKPDKEHKECHKKIGLKIKD